MAGLSVPLDEVIHFDVVTHDPGTGGQVTATSVTHDVFEEATDTPILANQTMTERASQTGVFRGTSTISAANGYEVGKYYSIVAEATAGGVTAHAVALSFRVVAAESVAGVPEVDMTHTVGGLVPTPATTGIPDVNVREWLDTACATPTVAGVPETDLTHVMGTILTEGAGGRLAAAFIKLFDVVTPTLVASDVMRGTNSAALASVVGALADAAAAGDPTVNDTIVQYVKQLINTLEGAVGIPAMPAAGAPANNISIAEMIRGIYDNRTIAAASYFDPTADAVANVTLVATLTTYTGNTLQTGDSYARIGADGASLSDLGGMSTAMKAEAATEVITGLKDSGFILHRATIQTVTNQTNFVIPATDDAVDTDAYKYALAVFIDGTDPNQISVRQVTAYNFSTRTVTVDSAPDFTVTNADTLCLLSASIGGARPTAVARTIDVAATGEVGLDLGNVTGVLGNANVGWVNGSNRIDVGLWLGTAVTLSAGAPDVNIQSTDDIDLTATQKASVNNEVDTALTTTTYAEPGQGLPAATSSIEAKLGYLFKAWRNRSNQTSTTYQLFNDDATTVDQKATVSDDATTAEKGEIATGP